MSGVTRGRIKAVAIDKSVPHNDRVGGAVNFVNQIQVESTIGKPFQIPGDSGSALLNDNNELIGLLHAGGADGFALATPIALVFASLDVALA
jgi:S1-C subfamily serine protease